MSFTRRDFLRGVGALAAASGCHDEVPPARQEPAREPTLSVRRANDRGGGDHGWLKTRHTFSFSRYHDPAHMGFGALRVINEDRVAQGRGFPLHPHQDMEIITYVLEGGLEHRDTLGNGSLIRPGDVQHMSAGTGIRHSEMNPSHAEEVHFLQIWIRPDRQGHGPSYGQQHFPVAERADRLRLVASSDGREGSLAIHQDAAMYVGSLQKGTIVDHEVALQRKTWIQIARGALVVNRTALSAGDGVSALRGGTFRLQASDDAELILFDLA